MPFGSCGAILVDVDGLNSGCGALDRHFIDHKVPMNWGRGLSLKTTVLFLRKVQANSSYSGPVTASASPRATAVTPL